MNRQQALSGKKIVITRPLHQAGSLSKYIEDWGGHSIVFPTLEIEGILDPSDFIALSSRLSCYNIAIFVSANAVRYASPLLIKSWNLPSIAIGPGTAKALHDLQIPVAWVPTIHQTEGILALPVLQNIQGQNILIFCGEDTRPCLKEGLNERGAHVEELFCYRRKCPQVEGSLILPQWQKQGIDLIISTSLDSLKNLWQILGGIDNDWLWEIPLLVISPKMQHYAQTLGFHLILLAEGASDWAICEQLSASPIIAS